MKWTLRSRLWSMLGVTLGISVTLAVVDLYVTERATARLEDLERHYMPLLAYGPEIEGRIERLNRALQDSVAAHDEEALEESEQLRRELHERLSQAPAIVERTALKQLEDALDVWYFAAREVSARLMRGEAGPAVVTEVETLQTKQRLLSQLVTDTVFLDDTRLAAAMEDARQAHRDSAKTRMVFRGALMIVVAVFSITTTRRIVTVLSELRGAFERFGGGDFSTPVSAAGGDELAAIAGNANHMAARLHELQDGLRAKQAELERSNRELEAFSYSVSHDLRAPLRAIDGFSQALVEDYDKLLDENGRGYLKRVRAGAQRMGELIDDLLALSRFTRQDLAREEVDVSALVREVVALLTADDKRAGAVEWLVEDGLRADADRRLLRVVFENLLGNAFKFTSKTTAPRIEIGQTRREHEVVFVVRDNGAGFDMAHAGRLFGAFQRLHAQSDYSGTGIGLATVSRIVGRHGGEIWVEAAVDRGAAFFFTLGASA